MAHKESYCAYWHCSRNGGTTCWNWGGKFAGRACPQSDACEHWRTCEMADDETRVRADFKAIRGCFDALRHGAASGQPQFDTVSMGMSHDRALAIEEGSTMVRIGSDIFGER